MIRQSLLVASAMALIVPSALADEVWASKKGHQIVYDRDVGSTAVLTYTPEIGLSKGQIFVVGLGGKYEGRATFQAYWVEADEGGETCPASLVDAEGKTWKRWGAAEVRFHKPAFPSAITVRRAACLGALDKGVKLNAVVGAGIQ